MDHVRWLADDISLTNPVIVAAFTGWNDAADAASTALRTMIETSGATALAEIDPEPFTDFATTRPHVALDEQRNRSIIWPTVGVWGASLPGTDVVLVMGPEPALRWRTFCDQITGIAQRVDAPMGFTLGALLADVPHTRRTQIIGTGTDTDLIERFDLERSRYEGPTGIVAVLHDAWSRCGLPTASLWAAVPGYAAQLPSPRAAVALLDRLCTMMGTPAPTTAITNQIADYDAQVDALISDDDDLVTYVRRLESMVDEMSGDDTGSTTSPIDDTDPESLAAEVEQFLRDHDTDG
ncbi:MAG: PAC2 family protein [Ilumatobacteraceae bacterium]|nr:PAC2 family protein [Ilumatobacteraceae bacterium]